MYFFVEFFATDLLQDAIENIYWVEVGWIKKENGLICSKKWLSLSNACSSIQSSNIKNHRSYKRWRCLLSKKWWKYSTKLWNSGSIYPGRIVCQKLASVWIMEKWYSTDKKSQIFIFHPMLLVSLPIRLQYCPSALPISVTLSRWGSFSTMNTINKMLLPLKNLKKLFPDKLPHRDFLRRRHYKYLTNLDATRC